MGMFEAGEGCEDMMMDDMGDMEATEEMDMEEGHYEEGYGHKMEEGAYIDEEEGDEEEGREEESCQDNFKKIFQECCWKDRRWIKKQSGQTRPRYFGQTHEDGPEHCDRGPFRQRT